MTSAPRYKLHHLEASRSLRVLWLLEYLQVPYTLEFYSRDPHTRLAANSAAGSGQGLAAIHPLGRSPVLEVEDGGERFTIAETGAILNYLLEHHGKVKPSEKNQRAQDLNFWVQFGESSIFLHTIPFMYGLRGGATTEDGSGIFDKTCARGLKADLDYVEQVLEKNNGSLQGGSGETIGEADIVVATGIFFTSSLQRSKPAQYWQNLGLEIGPRTQQWLQVCQQDKHFKAATEKEVKAGGKVEEGKDWLQPLTGSGPAASKS